MNLFYLAIGWMLDVRKRYQPKPAAKRIGVCTIAECDGRKYYIDSVDGEYVTCYEISHSTDYPHGVVFTQPNQHCLFPIRLLTPCA